MRVLHSLIIFLIKKFFYSIIIIQKLRLPLFLGPTNDRQQAVVAAFNHSWKAYKKYAWGEDELEPVTKSYYNWFNLGLTLVDSLDVMYIMGLNDGENKI